MSWVRVAVAFSLLPMGLLQGQIASRFVLVGEIGDGSLKELFDKSIIMAIDLSPDGKQIASLVTGARTGEPEWLVTLDARTQRIVASRKLGDSTVSHSLHFPRQVLYSSDQRYLVVQDMQDISVFDARTLELARTIPNSMSASHLAPLSMLRAAKSDVFVCAFGAEEQPMFGFFPTPVQIEVVDVSSGQILGGWISDDVPQSVSPNGELIAISWWRRPNQRRVVPLAVFDRNGQEIAVLDDGFSYSKSDDQSAPVGRAIGRFVSNREILLTPDHSVDEAFHVSGRSIRLLSVTGQHARQSVTPKGFAPMATLAISADGKTILVDSSNPIITHQPLDSFFDEEQRLRFKSKLLILGRSPKLQVESAVEVNSLISELAVSADGSVIAIHHGREIAVLMQRRHR